MNTPALPSRHPADVVPWRYRPVAAAVAMAVLGSMAPAAVLAQTNAANLPVRHTVPGPPSGGPVPGFISGAQEPVVTGTAMSITQTAPRAIIDWSSFNIAAGSSVNVAQPAVTSILLNRVVAGSVGTTASPPSTINGALQANGRVFILDPNGVVLGSTARVNVGGLLVAAMTMTSSDADFVNGVGLTLAQPTTGPQSVQVDSGAVIVGGTPNAEVPTGDVVLLGTSGTQFAGRINATHVFIGAGGGAQVPVGDSGFVSLKLTQSGATSARVTATQGVNGGISALGGTVDIQAAGQGESSVDWSANIDATGGSITMRGTGGEGDGVRVQAVSNTAAPVQLLAKDITLVGVSSFGTGVSISGVTAAASNSFNLGGVSTSGSGVQVSGGFGLANLTAPSINLNGRSELGTGVTLFSGTSLIGDQIDVRGMAVSTQDGNPIGVDLAGVGTAGPGLNLGGVRFVLGPAGTLQVSGLAALPASATAGSGLGLAMDGVVVTTPAGGGRSVTFAGEAVNGVDSAGIATFNDGGAGMLTLRGDTGASGANVNFGASSPRIGGAFVNFGGATSTVITGPAAAPVIDTTGRINLRPLGVDVNGNIVERPAQPIQIESDPLLFNTPFVVPADWLADFSFDSIGNIVAAGMVIGSAQHQGKITLGAGALRFDTLPLTLQNQGSGSAGVSLQGNGSSARELTLMSAGPVDQSGALRVGRLQLQGDSTNTVTLDNAGNEIGSLGFDRVGRLELVNHAQGSAAPIAMSLETGQLSGYDADLDAFTAFTPAANSAASKVLIQTDLLTLNSSVATTGAGSTLDLVAGSGFSSPGTSTLSTGAGGVWRVWAPTWETQLGALNGANPTPTLFGCVFGDTSTCSVSQVALPAGRSGYFFADQPVLVITPTSVSSPRGRPLPTLPYDVSGLVAGNSAAEAVNGSLSTPATSSSPVGGYPIQPGSLSSPLGYRLAFSTGPTDVSPQLTLTRPADLPDTPFGGPLVQLMSTMSSDTYGRNLAAPTMCMAPGAARRERSVAEGLDLLGLEWGRVRLQPQLSSCVDVASDSSCAAF